MIASVIIHVAMLVAQILVIVVWELGPLVSWWVFVTTLIVNALIYLWRVVGTRWRAPERLARVMADS
jgi:MATE family multidrug resistance protein